MARVIVVDALRGEDREQPDQSWAFGVARAEGEEGVENAPPAHAGELPHARRVAFVAEREQVDEEVLLGREVMEQTGCAHADPVGDHRQRRAPVAVGRECLACGAQNRLAAREAAGIGTARGHAGKN